ncbi:hypothetical protein [Streptomyces finlayi]|uniref:hypothetical protein n=1 Tax=Streptomyces finlayi TaxID=67296 RepID=UPI001674AB06|nr:hypothetical protein [Streptomyces finlayi]
MTALTAITDPRSRLQLLCALGTSYATDLTGSLRDLIATKPWAAANPGASTAREVDRFLDPYFHKARNQGPKRDHLLAAIEACNDTRTAFYRTSRGIDQSCVGVREPHDGTSGVLSLFEITLWGWYQLLPYTHQVIVDAADQHRRTPDRYGGTFTNYLLPGLDQPHGNASVMADTALSTLLTMGEAWSPYTYRSMSIELQRAQGAEIAHARWGGIEAAGREEAYDAATALVPVFDAAERDRLAALLAPHLAASEDFPDNATRTLAELPHPCTSSLHRGFGLTKRAEKEEVQARVACGEVRADAYRSASARHE